MTYTITPSNDKKYVILKVTGDINRRLAIKYDMEAHKIGHELGIDRYLMDLTESKNVESSVDNYEFAYKDIRDTPDIDRSARVAILVSPDDHSHDFIITVTRNSGLDVTLFIDREEAIRHLLQD
jgi:hypothetical protein